MSKDILVVANETVVGSALIDAVRRRAEGDSTVHVISPQSQPSHGYVIYDETVRGAAENRLAMTIAQLDEAGIKATGEVMDPDPYAAIMDALGERDFDEIVISTHPSTRSGWLRQDLVSASSRPPAARSSTSSSTSTPRRTAPRARWWWPTRPSAASR